MPRRKHGPTKKGAPPNPRSSRGVAHPTVLANAEKYRAAMDLRIQGYSLSAIARQLGASNHRTAWLWLDKGMRLTLEEPSKELRGLELARLDVMLQACWAKAIIRVVDDGGLVRHELGDGDAFSHLLKVLDRRYKLLGLLDWIPQLEESLGEAGWNPSEELKMLLVTVRQRSIDDAAADRKYDDDVIDVSPGTPPPGPAAERSDSDSGDNERREAKALQLRLPASSHLPAPPSVDEEDIEDE